MYICLAFQICLEITLYICITYIYTYIHIYIYLHTHIHIYIYMYVCMYVCMHACVYIYIYICIYAHILYWSTAMIYPELLSPFFRLDCVVFLRPSPSVLSSLPLHPLLQENASVTWYVPKKCETHFSMPCSDSNLDSACEGRALRE